MFALFFAVYDFQFKLNSSSCTVELSKRAHEDKQHTEIKHQSHLVIRILVSTCMVMEKSQELSTINVVEIIKNFKTQLTKVSSVQKDGKRCRKIQFQKNEKYQARNSLVATKNTYQKKRKRKKWKRKTLHNKNMNQEIHFHQQGPMMQMKVVKKN